MKNDILRLGLILFLITAIAAFLLGVVNEVTSPVIKEQIEQANNQARQTILPQADSFEILEKDFGPDVEEVFKGVANGNIVGYTIKTMPKGYGGPIEVTTGITIDGKISGVSIGVMTETPGLGAKITEQSYLDQYVGKSVESFISVIKSGLPSDDEIVSISGATITSDAVTNGVNESIRIFKEYLD